MAASAGAQPPLASQLWPPGSVLSGAGPSATSSRASSVAARDDWRSQGPSRTSRVVSRGGSSMGKSAFAERLERESNARPWQAGPSHLPPAALRATPDPSKPQAEEQQHPDPGAEGSSSTAGLSGRPPQGVFCWPNTVATTLQHKAPYDDGLDANSSPAEPSGQPRHEISRGPNTNQKHVEPPVIEARQPRVSEPESELGEAHDDWQTIP
ncbi:hypothetical protein WJX72_009228 [[Myrmecia] bisecta]|uniref:Uncharacterized protein n=1 Tax=[Myrmecia] bisecta TaxID=41462 RepID=A0AAW1R8Y6_9CHLO